MKKVCKFSQYVDELQGAKEGNCDDGLVVLLLQCNYNVMINSENHDCVRTRRVAVCVADVFQRRASVLLLILICVVTIIE